MAQSPSGRSLRGATPRQAAPAEESFDRLRVLERLAGRVLELVRLSDEIVDRRPILVGERVKGVLEGEKSVEIHRVHRDAALFAVACEDDRLTRLHAREARRRRTTPFDS